MPNSMTGFAEEQGVYAGLRMIWRLRSVNHRYLDLSFRRPGHWPGNWHDLEGQASKRLQAHFARGHLDCELSLVAEAETEQSLELNHGLLQDLLRLEGEVQAHSRRVSAVEGERGHLTMGQLLAWPGMIRTHTPQESDAPGWLQAALEILEVAVGQLAVARAAEGRALTAVIQQLLDEFGGLLTQVERLLPDLRNEQKRLLQVRVAELAGTTVDPGELAREVAILLNRVDIAEEVERLHMHRQAFDALLSGAEPAGRRLDFFCQELNREVNTICSKSQNGELTRLGVEMKLIVEKLREQAQNLE
ncbi:MAG: YicC family protein [Magnetococcales bacterium]|nr:YicC family protein [Magnetococcales bacterium]